MRSWLIHDSLHFIVILIVIIFSTAIGSSFDWKIVIAILIGGFFPDIDHPRSFISRGYWSVLSAVIRKTTGHRGWTHSLFGAGLFTGIFLIILWFF